MLEQELQQYLQREYPQENARCEWKEFKNLKNSFCGADKDNVASYVSAKNRWRQLVSLALIRQFRRKKKEFYRNYDEFVENLGILSKFDEYFK